MCAEDWFSTSDKGDKISESLSGKTISLCSSSLWCNSSSNSGILIWLLLESFFNGEELFATGFRVALKPFIYSGDSYEACTKVTVVILFLEATMGDVNTFKVCSISSFGPTAS